MEGGEARHRVNARRQRPGAVRICGVDFVRHRDARTHQRVAVCVAAVGEGVVFRPAEQIGEDEVAVDLPFCAEAGDAGLGVQPHGARVHQNAAGPVVRPRAVGNGHGNTGGLDHEGRSGAGLAGKLAAKQRVAHGGGRAAENARAQRLVAVQVAVLRKAHAAGVCAPQHIVGRGLALGFVVVVAGGERELFQRAVGERQAAGLVVPAAESVGGGGAAEIEPGVGVIVAGVAVEIRCAEGDFGEQLIAAQRACELQLDAAPVAAAGIGAQMPRGLVRGLPGHIVDGAGEGVAAVKGVLRAFHHLHALHIQQPGVEHSLPLQVNAVHEDAHILHPRRDEAGAEAADDRVAGVARVGEGLVGEAHGAGGDVFQAARPHAVEIPGVQCGDGQGHILQRFLAPARGDDDLVNCGHLLLAGGFLRLCREREARRQCQRQRAGRNALKPHGAILLATCAARRGAGIMLYHPPAPGAKIIRPRPRPPARAAERPRGRKGPEKPPKPPGGGSAGLRENSPCLPTHRIPRRENGGSKATWAFASCPGCGPSIWRPSTSPCCSPRWSSPS